ncbi:MAG TPA: thiamine pyrophosphate-dependent enzyme [Candidatus Poseidoniia archaeon]|jgi:2-oxoisovalerate dehydrogenase E1 component alpha subunit|nr:thiamine pyrophosphate-dependent enzyme [Candidatus Poseidoniia archaeon]
MSKKKTLHVPDAPFRPGEKPDFSNLELPKAGDAKRPKVMIEPSEIRDLAFSLVRVLDDKHEAVGPWDPKLDASVLKEGLRHMCLLRIFDDRMQTMQRQGKLSFYMKSLGEEAVAIAQGMALRPDDILFPSYRQPGLQFVRGRDIVDMICHCITNAKDNVKGRQMPVHYSWKEGNLVSISSPVGTQFPQAVGCAMASAYKGEDNVSISWVGDGTAAEGDFHYALNFASVYKAPVLLNVVNNQWAISTHKNISSGGSTFAARGIAYDVPSIRVDGNDFLALYSVTSWAAERARKGGGPTFIEVFTYRGEAHSTSDDPTRYRPKDEWKSWPLGDPIERLKAHLIGLEAWSEKEQNKLEKELDALVIKSYKEAEKHGTLSEGPWASEDTLFEDVYKKPPRHLRKQRQEFGF